MQIVFLDAGDPFRYRRVTMMLRVLILGVGVYSQISGALASIPDVAPGTVVIISENHGHEIHHARQVEAIETLGARLPDAAGLTVAFEFFARTDQEWVDRYVAGDLAEPEFLTRIGWGKSPSFDFYRRQALAPSRYRGRTLAINLDRSVSGRIAKVGVSQLTPEERAFLPDDFTLGNENYRSRFEKVMGGHVPPQAVQRYFEAQSAWDDTMAETVADFSHRNPMQVIVIIVGDFHAAYGGGLPDRLKARGVDQLLTVSQVDSTGLTDSERKELMDPHPLWGARADLVWDAYSP